MPPRSRQFLARAFAAALFLAAGAVDARAAACSGANPIKCRVKKGGAGPNFLTIQSAVNAIVTPLTDNYQVLVDSQMYSEQVVVQNLNTALHNKTIAILSDPVMIATATPINPPAASAAAFVIMNASVTVAGFNIVSTNTVAYGVFISSAYVQLSSVNVQDGAGKIATAGIVTSSWTTVGYTSVTVAGAGATGFWLPGSTMTSVSFSSAAAKSATGYALWLDEASSNTFTVFLASNPAGVGAYLSAATDNDLSLSTFTSSAANGFGLAIFNALSNSVIGSYAFNAAGTAVYLSTGAADNTLSQSTVAARTAGFFALNLTDNSSNTLTGCLVNNSAGGAAYLSTTSFNTLSKSTFNASGGAGVFGLVLYDASSNTVSGSFASNAAGTAVYLSTDSVGNSVSQSTFFAKTAGYFALNLTDNSSNTLTGVFVNNTTGGAAYLSTTSFNVLNLSTFTASGGAGVFGLALYDASSNTVSGSFAFNAAGTAVYLSTDSVGNSVSQSTFAAKTAGYYALNLTDNSSNTLTGVFVNNTAGGAAYLSTTSFNVLSQSSFTASGGAGVFGLALYDASSTTIGASYAFNAAGSAVYFSTDSDGNSVIQSTFFAKTGGYFALNLTNNSGNTVANSFVGSTGGGGAYLSTTSFDALLQSTFNANGGAGIYALALYNVDSSTIDGSYASNAGGSGVLLSTGSSADVVSNSTVTVNIANFMALYLVGASSNAVTGSFVSNQRGHAAYLFAGSNANVLSQSTFTSNAATFKGLYLNGVSSTVISVDYVQGATAAYVSGSTGTEIDGSALFASIAAGSALHLDRGSSGLALTGTRLTAPVGGAGVYLDAGDGGLIALSTDVITGAGYGVLVATPAAGTSVWITSCTVVPGLTNANNTYGLLLDGLTTGATIENNAIYYRTTGAINTRTSYAFYANTSAGILFDHNEIDDPGGITSGSFYGTYLSNADQVSYKFNSVYSSAPALTAAFLLRAGEGSVNLLVKDNIFFSSFTVPGAGNSTGTIAVADAASEAGFVADYNDYFSSNAALGFRWGASGVQGLVGWRGASGGDANSITAHPLWASVFPGAEDFHARSVTGRYDAADGLMDLVDGVQSPTIDAGDPLEDASLEPAPNGGVVNQGSSGGTAQASESGGAANFPGCAVQRTVNQLQGPYFSIQSAVSSFPASLAAEACAVIEDGATYLEQVAVQNFAMGPGASIAIFADPGSGLTPTVNPPAGTAGFTLANASVSLSGVNLLPANALTYGVFISSPFAQLSGVNVNDPNGRITAAGVLASSWTTVSGSSVTVAAANAAGFWLPGSTMTMVTNSSATVKSAARYALWLNGASSITVSGFFANNTLGSAAALDLGAGGDSLSLSTFTSNTAAKFGLLLSSAVSTTISASYVQGTTAAYVAGSTGTEIDGSSLFATAAAGSALQLDRGAIGLTLTGSQLTAPTGGAGVYLGAGDGGLIALSTDVIAGAGYGVLVATPAAGTSVWITSCTIVPGLTNANNTYGLFLDGLTTGATIENNAIYYRTTGAINARTSYAFYANTCAGVLFDHNEIDEPGGITSGSFYGTYLTNADQVTYKFNSVYSSAPALTAAFLLRAGEGSANLLVKDNVFFSSFTVPLAGNSTGTIAVADAASEAGFAADYNDYFSSNASLGFRWGPTSGPQGLAAWRVASGKDANSIAAHPLWASIAPGAEDFHALSVAGRWSAATQSRSLQDGAQSPTIDAGDPAETAAAAAEADPLTSTVNQGSNGGTLQASLGAPAPPSISLVSVQLSSETASFSTVGAPGYVVQASTKSDFSLIQASSSTTTNATALAPQGLDPNTTYYLRAGAQYGATAIFNAVAVASASTLANPVFPGALEFLSIQTSSVTVAWAAPDQTAVSSRTNEGYILQASSDDFGALAPGGAPVSSSATVNVGASVFLSTLTVGSVGAPLDLSNTYYFQVATLNWAGQPNYTRLPRLNFQIAQSTNALHLGAMDPNVARSTVSTSSMVVTNVGNWPVTLELSASTATLPSSPWTLGTATGVETAVLMGVWYGGPVGPPPSAFTTFLTTSTRISQASGNYSSSSPPGNAQNGFQLAPGANVTLWFQFTLPDTSSTLGPESMQTAVLPVYP